MYAPKYRLDAIETIGRKILLEYDRALLEGPPQAIPIETIIETKFDLILEYHTLRKNGSVLGETIFDDGAAILYDRTERRYRLIAVKAGTIWWTSGFARTDFSAGCGLPVPMNLAIGSFIKNYTPEPGMWQPMRGKPPQTKAMV